MSYSWEFSLYATSTHTSCYPVVLGSTFLLAASPLPFTVSSFFHSTFREANSRLKI